MTDFASECKTVARVEDGAAVLCCWLPIGHVGLHYDKNDVVWWTTDAVSANPAEGGRLAAIRAVLDEVDWAFAAAIRRALDRIDQIANSSRTESGTEPGGTAYLTPADVRTVIDALDRAAIGLRDEVDDCGECARTMGGLCANCDYKMTVTGEFDAVAAKLGGAR